MLREIQKRPNFGMLVADLGLELSHVSNGVEDERVAERQIVGGLRCIRRGMLGLIDCFVSTICLDHHMERQDVIRKCLPAYAATPGLRLRILDFGSTDRQRRWMKEQGFEVITSSPFPGLSWYLEGSERRRFLFANRLSESPVYVVGDDDCQPVKGWLEAGLKAMEDYPSFGILALDSEGGVSSDRELFHDGRVHETLSCGGIRFIRKGAVKRYCGYEGEKGYDRKHADCMREAGFKTGFIVGIRRLHLGGHCSVFRERTIVAAEMDSLTGEIAFQ